jgi:hypothetical protein
MPIRRGTFASGVINEKPTVVLLAATNFNQSIATLNATVSGNLYSTTVKFQYNTTNNFSSFTEVNAAITPIGGQNISSYANITGLSVNTTYYFRCVATNDNGTTTSSSTSFVTWSLKTYANGTGGSYSLTIPTVTPTGGSAIIPTVYNMFIYGGGGGAGYAGGGGGGYRLLSSRAFTNNSSTVLSFTVGAGGGAQAAGGTTSISASNWSTLSAGGGGGGSASITGAGGNVGFGDNAGHAGGAGAYFSDKFGTAEAAGGGAGIGGAGGNATAAAFTGGIGGNGGAGGTAYGYDGGAGGRGYGTSGTYGTNGAYWKNFGSGGEAINGGGSAGLVYFQYYGP